MIPVIRHSTPQIPAWNTFAGSCGSLLGTGKETRIPGSRTSVPEVWSKVRSVELWACDLRRASRWQVCSEHRLTYHSLAKGLINGT